MSLTPSGYQGGRWNIVSGCTCLWQCPGQPGQMGWDILADDLNCPAHHPADAIVKTALNGAAAPMPVPIGDEELEQAIRDKGLTAPRVTADSIKALIVYADYHVFPGTTVTVCCLGLRNGYQVIGQSAAASPENFDAEIGRKVAYADAFGKIWALEGYLLREKLSKVERSERT